MAFDPDRVLDDLRALDRETGGPDGARRVCWTPGWERARAFLLERLRALPVEVDVDEAGNLWARLDGPGRGAVAVGSHLDSVPQGGWLDGALGVMAALEVLRWHAELNERPCPVVLVDWADEEGGRFGRSLFGSSAAAGQLAAAELQGIRDADGVLLSDALPEFGVDLGALNAVRARLDDVAAAVELHIEQGPVLEARGDAAAAVDGVVGVAQVAVTFIGRSGHAGTTPMDRRADALLAGCELALEAARIASASGAVATVGQIGSEPGVKTVIPRTLTLALDVRHGQRRALAGVVDAIRGQAEAIAGARGCVARWEPTLVLDPVAFEPELVEIAAAACARAGSHGPAITSGALHDSALIARVVPAVMVFAASREGISHDPAEDTSEADLAAALEAFGATVGEVMAWVARRSVTATGARPPL